MKKTAQSQSQAQDQPQNQQSPKFDPGQDDQSPISPELTAAATRIVELTNDLQRTRADFENFRKQVDLQKSQAMAVAKNATVMKLLPLIDDFSRAISTYPEQLQPLEKSLLSTLQSLGLQIINSAPGTEFNPDYHDAVSVDDSEGSVEVITETLRPGYTYDGAVIRAAMVRVGHADKANGRADQANNKADNKAHK